MLLPHFIDNRRLPVILLLALVFAGCAGGGPTRAPDSGRDQPSQVEAVEGQPEEAAIPPEVKTRYEQAASAMAAGDMMDAELRFKEFLALYPDYPGAHVNLAIIHANNENNAAARASLDAALALNPNHPAALNQLGMLLRKDGKFLEAEAAYLKAVTASPDYALAHYNLGVLNELYLQRLDVALQNFETYQALVGEDKQVEKWIADLRRRVAATQRTANVAE